MKRHRKAKRRRSVSRIDRVKPPPEAAQHARPWPMMELLTLGHPDGIDAEEFEAALQIVEAFKVLTSEVGLACADGDPGMRTDHVNGVMSDRDAERIVVWFTWSRSMPAGMGPRLVAEIEDQVVIESPAILRWGCRLWASTRADLGRSLRVDRGRSFGFTSQVARDLPGTPQNLTAGPPLPQTGGLHHLPPMSPSGQISRVTNALAASSPPTIRTRGR